MFRQTQLERDPAAGVPVPKGTRVIATTQGPIFWAKGERGALVGPHHWESDVDPIGGSWMFDHGGEEGDCCGLEYDRGYVPRELHEDEGG